MCEHGSLQMMCEIWITLDALDKALPACLAAPCRLLARFPGLCTVASVWEVLYPACVVQGIFKDAHEAPLVWFTTWIKSIVIQIIRTITKFSVCFCSYIVRLGVNGEACMLLSGLWGLNFANPWCISLAVVVFGWIYMVRCSWTRAGPCSSELVQCML